MKPLAPTAALMRSSVSSMRGAAITVTGASSADLPCSTASSGGRQASWRSRCCGAAQPVVDGAPQPRLGNRHHRDRAVVRPVERAQRGKEIGGRLDEIAALAQRAGSAPRPAERPARRRAAPRRASRCARRDAAAKTARNGSRACRARAAPSSVGDKRDAVRSAPPAPRARRRRGAAGAAPRR